MQKSQENRLIHSRREKKLSAHTTRDVVLGSSPDLDHIVSGRPSRVDLLT